MEQGVMGVTMFFDTLSCFIFIPFLSLPDNPDEMNKFELTSAYHPTGDQPEAIAQLTEGVREGVPAQTLLGVTGSGKTFTIANVIANINKPTLILSHNKTLAAQLYSEFKGFFPNNAVEYYVSYYDYYQPEAYLPSSDTYIEKDLAINDEIDKLRLAATSALLSGRKDVVVVSSVSCIYGMGNPADFYNNVIEVQQGKNYSRNVFLRRLVDSLYVRNDIDLNRGNFRVKGDTVDIYLAYADNLLRIVFWGDEIDSIEEVDPVSGVMIARFDAYKIYPANLFMTTKEAMQGVSAKKRAIQSVVCGIMIGLICGFVGAGGGMMMLLILTSVLGYELKTAVGTSVFIMAFTAFTGAVSHFMIVGAPDWTVFILCVVFTLIWARIAARFANKATPETLNRATGVILVILGIVVLGFSMLS